MAKSGSVASSYTVRYELDETRWWVASIPKVAGCLTQGRTIDQARERIREALALFIGDGPANKAELIDDVVLPAGAKKAVTTAQKRRAEFAEVEKQTQSATRAAALALADCGLSMRDVGTLLGLTRQRAHQLLKTA